MDKYKYTEEEKKFLSNWATYLALLRCNRWKITKDLIKEPLKQWEEINGKVPDKIFAALALILFPYVKESTKVYGSIDLWAVLRFLGSDG